MQIFDLTRIIYKQLNVDELTDLISGKIYRETNGVFDDKENIIIISTALENNINTNVSKAIININVEVPNIAKAPNIAKFETLLTKIKELLKNQNNEGYYFTFVSEQLIKEDNYYYLNIKIKNLIP